MDYTTIALYCVWGMLPACLFLAGLWNWLEGLGKKKKGFTPAWFLKQGIYLCFCVGAAIIFDQYFLADLVASFSPHYIPLGFYRIILLPAILLLTAKLFGGSKPVKIEKITRIKHSSHKHGK